MKNHPSLKKVLALVINQVCFVILSRKARNILVLAGLTTMLLSCSTQNQIPYKSTLVVFGTLVNIVIYHEPHQAQQAEQAVLAVERSFQQFHQQWHAWEQGGIISKINQAIAQQTPITVTNSVKSFILQSQKLTQKSQGLFDPGIGQLVALWGFHSETWQGPPPSQEAIQHWLNNHPSLLDIYFQDNILYSRNPNVQLDFGGNAKGLAIHMALERLKQSGIQNALVSIGGDMKVIGSKNGEPWRVGIQNPKKPNLLLASLSLKHNEAIVTSGNYQRYFEWQGKRYSHVLNPKTGYPADSFASVTVLHPNAITADAGATALLIAGPKQWKTIAQSLGIRMIFAVDHHGKIFQTEAMAARISLL